jgi:hypothetical protein
MCNSSIILKNCRDNYNIAIVKRKRRTEYINLDVDSQTLTFLWFAIVKMIACDPGLLADEVLNQDLAPIDWKTLLAQVIVSASYLPPSERFYDLHLDHWGFTREDGDDFQQMFDRLKVAIGDWAASEYSGFWDNSIVGV